MRKLLRYFRDNPVIREYDDGRLTAAGFAWSEPVEVILIPFELGAIVLLFGAFAAAAYAQIATAFMVGFAALACVVICILFGWIARGIAFTSGGRVSIRGGWINRIEMLRTIKEHTAIVSIEIIKTYRGTGIVIYTSWGGTFIISDALEEPAARLAAVQLTIALREMRESLTSIQNFQRPQHAHSAPSQAWID